MIFFAKKDRKREEEIEKIKDLVSGTEAEQEAKVMETVPEPEEEPQVEPKPIKESAAPLFVKIEKYQIILDIISGLRATLIMAKNALAIQRELHRLTVENMGLIQSALEKVDQKIAEMDVAFLRPKGYEEEVPEAEYEAGELEDVVSNLREQIKDLREDLKNIE